MKASCNHSITKVSIRITHLGYSLCSARPHLARVARLRYTLAYVQSARFKHSVSLPPNACQASIHRHLPTRCSHLSGLRHGLVAQLDQERVCQPSTEPAQVHHGCRGSRDRSVAHGRSQRAPSRSIRCAHSRHLPASQPADNLKWLRAAHGTRRVVGRPSSRGTLPARPAGRSGRERDQAEADKRARLGLLRTGEPGRRRTRRGEAPL